MPFSIQFPSREFYPVVAALVMAGCAAPSGDAPVLSTVVVGHCAYDGPFSKLPECKDYVGAWKVADAEKDCSDVRGTFESGVLCAPATSLGMCLDARKPEQTRTYIATDNTSKCGSARTGCEVFGGGYWQPAAICGGASSELVVSSEEAFREPQQKCLMNVTGVDGGALCIWESIHGATAEGRSFRDDANCDASRSGRPYYFKDPNPRFSQADSRRSDPTYLAEESWVRSQVNAASCVCCHSTAAPGGLASIFDIDREGSLANQLTDRGIAQASGLMNSIPLGAFPAEVNNGFSRADLAHPEDSVFMTTDRARMKAFWQRELEWRNLSAADFVGVPDGFGPLSEQYYFQPQACSGGEGIAADGTITWGNGRARYVYVMRETSRAPTVFPNLDLPADTLWRLDVPPEGAPLVSGSVKYGVVPDGLRQRFPVAGAPAALESGARYFLYVSANQMLPITRCLITAP